MKANRRSGRCMAGSLVLAASLLSATAAEARGPHVRPIPYRPGSLVWATTPPPGLQARPLSNGCDRVPATGYIGSGVYSQSGTHVSGSWDWSGSSAGEPFHWYIFTPGG